MRRGALALALAALVIAACGSDSGGSAGQAQAPADRAVVWAVGDGADGSATARALANRIARDRPDRFLYLGDVYPTGTAADFARNYAAVYGRLNRITSPTTGNHDWGNSRSGYLPYWRRVKGRPQPYWYSLRLAGWEILGLSSEAAHSAGSEQLRWLRSRLRAPGTCRLAFWHRPRFSAGIVHGDAPDVAPFWQALRGHARLVVNGHEHMLQRFRKRAGLTEYVAGAGGAILYGYHPDRRLAFARSALTGALRMVLAPGRARLELRSANGALLDVSRATCRKGG
jgi:acid phosphatase type 7